MHPLRIPLVLLIILCATTPIFAQTNAPKTGSVTGKLVDGQNKPVSYATVTLLRADSSVINGDLSKDDASFNISPTGIGNFRLRIESIGATTKFVAVQITADAPDKNVGNIKIAATENSLKEVSVVGERPVMELKVDKKVFNVEKNTTTAGGSATDVLQNVPSVSVDESGNVSLRGKTDVTILIDGKPSTMLGSDVASALQSLPAGSIESVEVITNPSAKYDAQGTGGIINIITKKDGRFGMNGTATLGAGTRDKYNGNLGLNIKKGKWSAFLNSSFRLNSTYNNVTTDRVDKDTATGALGHSYHTYEHVPRHFDGAFNTVGVTYDPDKYNSFTVTQNVNYMQFGFKDTSNYYIYQDPNEGSAMYHQTQYSNFFGCPFSLSSAVDYKRKFKKKDEELSVDATYAQTTMTRQQDYYTLRDSITNSFKPLVVQHAPGDGSNNTLTIWADYTDPLFTKNGKLGLGFKSTLYNFKSSNDPRVDSSGTNSVFVKENNLVSDYNYSQEIHAAYVNWNDQYGKFSYQVGLRFEDAIYHGTGKYDDASTGNLRDTSFHNEFANPFPSAFISYQLPNQQSIYLNYSRRTNRPSFMQLLPFIDLSNPSTVNTGNPGLKPEFISNIEFSYSKADKKGNNYILSAYYAYTENLIEKITSPIKPDVAARYNVPGSDLFTQPWNIAHGTTYGLEGTGHVQILPIWDATLNANFFWNQLVIGDQDPEVTKYLSNNSGFTWFGKVNTSIKLPANFSLQINANYESPKVITQGNLKETYWVDVALRKNLWKNKATLIINCSDVFKTHEFVTNYNLSNYNETINRVKETRIGNITFTYRFGKQDMSKSGGGKRGKTMDDKNKPPKPTDEDRGKNMKEGDDNDQGGGGPGGNQGGKGGGGGAKMGN
jgi:outer membrane receptor protein involved in Fe transport